MNVVSKSPAGYNFNWPAMRIIGFGGVINYGVVRNNILDGLPDQFRQYGSNPSTLKCEWIIDLDFLDEWLEWMEVNGVGNYFVILIPSQNDDLFPQIDKPVELDLVTIVSPMQMNSLGADRMIVRAELAVWPRDIGKGRLGVGGDTGAPGHVIGDWIIAGEPDNPSIDWIIAGTPPAPNNQNNVAAGRPGDHA